MSRVLIVGAGVTGCSAARDIAQHGHSVVLVEPAPLAGGKLLSYCCKATDECSRCGVCVGHTAIAECLAHPRVELLGAASIDSVRRTPRKHHVSVTRKHPSVLASKCTDCGACVKACPAKCITRYDRGDVVQYGIDHSRCRRHLGKACRKCETACTSGAITGRGKSSTSTVQADAALIAVGHEAYDATGKPALGYGRLEGVMTGEEAEARLCTQSYLSRPPSAPRDPGSLVGRGVSPSRGSAGGFAPPSTQNAHPGENVAFVQCVGSRDPEIGRNYCSSVCCAYATRMARMLKHANPESRVAVHFIDLQNFDKTFDCFRQTLADEGVELVRSTPFAIDRRADGKLVMQVEGPDAKRGAVEYDAVVLSTGMGPAPGAARIADLFGVGQGEFGFLTSADGVLVAGTCGGPATISDSMASASAAAAQIIARLPAVARKKTAAQQPAKTKKVRLSQRVLVIGAGAAGIHTARALRDLGHRPTVIESEASPGGRAACGTGKLTPLLSGIEVMPGTKILALDGQVGRFTARLQAPDGPRDLKFSAVVAGTGVPVPDPLLPAGDAVMAVDIADLGRTLARAKPRDVPRAVGIVLDLNFEESVASMEAALREAIAARRNCTCEVYLFCREARVAALHLEKLHNEARVAGVTIVKYTGELTIDPTDEGVLIRAFDVILGQECAMECDLAAVSPYGVSVEPDNAIVSLLGVHTDAMGQVQDNNLHLFPGLTSRPGVFTVGACRGQRYLPDVARDASATALAVHDLLAPGVLEADLANASVDAAKCALCLTCIRSCPHGAMRIDDEKRAAASMPEVCRQCGICVGECPAGAISMPGEMGND